MTRAPLDVAAAGFYVQISLVIPTFNRVDLLSRCLKSVLSQQGKSILEVIVALDARDTASEVLLEKYVPQVTVVRSMRGGSNAARNRGKQQARGAIIVFLDDDCVLPREDWIVRLGSLFKRHPEADVAGGLYLSENNAPLFVRCRNQMSNAYVLDSRVSALETRVLLGGASAYRREVFLRWGVFDELLGYGAAETELNSRIINGEGRFFLFDELAVVHAMTPRSLYQYCCQAFMQGRGFAYSGAKNKKYPYAGKGVRATLSYLWDIVAQQRLLDEKLGAIMFIFLNVLAYRFGLCWGSAANAIKSLAGVRAHGETETFVR